MPASTPNEGSRCESELLEEALRGVAPRCIPSAQCTMGHLRAGLSEKRPEWGQTACEMVIHGSTLVRDMLAADTAFLEALGAYLGSACVDPRRWERFRRTLLLLLAPTSNVGTLQSAGMRACVVAYLQRSPQLLLPLFEALAKLPGGCDLLLEEGGVFLEVHQSLQRAGAYCIAPLSTLLSGGFDQVTRNTGFMSLISDLVQAADTAGVALLDELCNSNPLACVSLLDRHPALLASIVTGTVTCLVGDRGVGHLHTLVSLAVSPEAGETLLASDAFKQAMSEALAIGFSQQGLSQGRTWQQAVRLVKSPGGRAALLGSPDLLAAVLHGLRQGNHQPLAAAGVCLLLSSEDSRKQTLDTPQLMTAVTRCLGGVAESGCTHDWDCVLEQLVRDAEAQALILASPDALAALAAGVSNQSARSMRSWDALLGAPAALLQLVEGLASSSSSGGKGKAWVQATAVLLDRQGAWELRLRDCPQLLPAVVAGLKPLLTAGDDAEALAATAAAAGGEGREVASTSSTPRWCPPSGPNTPRATEDATTTTSSNISISRGSSGNRLARSDSSSSRGSSSTAASTLAKRWKQLLMVLVGLPSWQERLLACPPLLQLLAEGIILGDPVCTDTLAHWLRTPGGLQQVLQQEALLLALQQRLQVLDGSGSCATSVCLLLQAEAGRAALSSRQDFLEAMVSSLAAEPGEWRLPLELVLYDAAAVDWVLLQQQGLLDSVLRACLLPGWATVLLRLLGRHRRLRALLLDGPDLFDAFLCHWGTATGEELVVLQEVWGYLKPKAVPVLLQRLVDPQLVEYAWRALLFLGQRSTSAAAQITEDLQKQAAAAQRVMLLEEQTLALQAAALELAQEHAQLRHAAEQLRLEREALEAERAALGLPLQQQ